MQGECPSPPQFNKDKIGQLTQQAWQEQEGIGWVQVAQGRLSKKWGEAQGVYYAMNPSLKGKKYFTPLAWTKTMVGALLDMSLTMWKNRCDSLHGKTKGEQVQKKRNKLRKQIERCYRNFRQIPER